MLVTTTKFAPNWWQTLILIKIVSCGILRPIYPQNPRPQTIMKFLQKLKTNRIALFSQKLGMVPLRNNNDLG